jgi:hypothetical protein
VAESAVWSSEVVALEVAGQGGGALGGAAVDALVGPFVEERLDQAFCLSVGAGPVGLGAQVAQAELGERVA